MLFRAAKVLNKKLMRDLYYTFCYPHILYGIALWGGTYPTTLHSLTLMQKKIVRILAKSAYLEQTHMLFKTLRILKIYDVYKLKTSIFMFLFSTNSLPNIFDNFFHRCNNENHITRNVTNNHFKLPKCKINIKKHSILYQGPTIFNRLDNSLKNKNTIVSFKKNIVKLLLEEM